LLWTYFQNNPARFVRDANAEYRNSVSGSKHTDEVISAAYLRGDLSFLESRLKVVGGVRAEQTNNKAEGPLTDDTRNFQRNASGQILRNAAGAPLLIVPTSNTLGVSQLTFLERAAHTEKEYLRLLPSINASYNIRDNLIARAAYFQSIGRPDNEQYAGGITVPNLANPPSGSNQIRVNNAGIKPWSARSVVVRLEYYFEGVGQFTIGAFRRNLTDAFGGTTFAATPAFLALYNLDASLYGQYDVRTNQNLPDTLRLEGLNFSYKQALTFLPRWARGVQVFANGSTQRATGANVDLFTDMFLTPRSGSWGVSLTREKFRLNANWTFTGQRRRVKTNENPPSIGPGTFRWTSQEIKVDLLGEYRLTKRYAVFANLRNFTSTPGDTKIYGPQTAPVGRLRQREEHSSIWTFGIQGTY
jgi:iron complex outermembrane recepter protein